MQDLPLSKSFVAPTRSTNFTWNCARKLQRIRDEVGVVADGLHTLNRPATEMAVADLDWVLISLDRAIEALTKETKRG